ncbi:multicopper oxidase domain-containing protein [Actinomadura sp. NPDC047616]|uniref:multicopper oxidase domain-containing protein n=1 Tax=Actinomadura sp. NPDC047616 TaxID=3155914 RepID=UPI0034071F1E
MAARRPAVPLSPCPSASGATSLPARLADVPAIPPRTAVRTRTFELAEHQINGRKMDPGRIDAHMLRDTTEIWDVRSGDGTLHSFHVHDVQFQVLSVDDRRPPPHLSGWKDTVLLPPGTRMRLIMRFADYADPHRPYMFHCHMLYHEDQGMMGQFLVLERGQTPAPPPSPGLRRHHH